MKRKSGPWFGNDRERLLFELPLRQRGVNFRVSRSKGVTYYVTILLGHFDTREAAIRFDADLPRWPRVTADGPDDSPHRYRDERLCMWDPDDPDAHRWVFSDGLHTLVDMVACHLYREAHYRASPDDEWLGPEAPHSPEERMATQT